MIWGSKSRLAKATGAEPCGHIWEMKSCTPLWGEARLEVKMYKAHQRRTTFESWDVEKCTPVWREDPYPLNLGSRRGTWQNVTYIFLFLGGS